MRKLLLIIFFVTTAHCSFANQDSVSKRNDSSAITKSFEPSTMIYQFLGGSIVYAALFWPLGGKEYIVTGENQLHSLWAAMIGSGLTVSLIGNILCDCDGSYWAGVGGAFLGGIIAAPISGAALRKSDDITLKYTVLSVLPVTIAIAIYQWALSYKDYTPSSQHLYISPIYEKESFGLNFMMRF